MTDANGDKLIRQIKRTLNVLVVATVVLTLGLGAVAVTTYLDGRETHSALCTLRGDLQARVDSSRKFLAEHPKGFAGIPAKTIQDGITNQERTIAALSTLNC